MKLSISNIAWDEAFDQEMYIFLEKHSFDGIEIAPTRIWKENPYDHIKEAKEYKVSMLEKYNLHISSIQSIWFGRTERIFGSQEERQKLIDYTQKAFEFANVLGCKNIVFGCPKNRNIVTERDSGVNEIATGFFCKLAQLAKKNDTILSIEANPPIYHTNYLNKTKDAVALVRKVNHQGIAINYDLGTALENREQIGEIKDYIQFVNHVHISEPELRPVIIGHVQENLCLNLKKLNYRNYISIEMGNLNNISKVQEICINLKKTVRGKLNDMG